MENFLERLLLLSDFVFDPGIFHELLQEIEMYNFPQRSITGRMAVHIGRGKRGDGQETLLDEVLLEAKFCKKKAAQMLGISRTTLWRKMKTP